MKTAFRDLLMADPVLRAMAPGGVDWGIHPQAVPGDYIVLQQISMVVDRLQRGLSSLITYRVQLDCYALTDLDADAMARRCLTILDGHKVEPFQGILFLGARDVTDGETNQPIHGMSMDFTVIYRG